MRLRDRDSGLVFVDGHECGGLAVAPRHVVDEIMTAAELSAWRQADFDDRGERPEPVSIDGFQVVHALSGLTLTPIGWSLPTFAAAAECIGILIDRTDFGAWERPAETLAAYRPLVLAAHEKAGAFMGKSSHIRRLDAAIDMRKLEAVLGELRRAPSCEDWKLHGPVGGWGNA